MPATPIQDQEEPLLAVLHQSSSVNREDALRLLEHAHTLALEVHSSREAEGWKWKAAAVKAAALVDHKRDYLELRIAAMEVFAIVAPYAIDETPYFKRWRQDAEPEVRRAAVALSPEGSITQSFWSAETDPVVLAEAAKNNYCPETKSYFKKWLTNERIHHSYRASMANCAKPNFSNDKDGIERRLSALAKRL